MEGGPPSGDSECFGESRCRGESWRAAAVERVDDSRLSSKGVSGGPGRSSRVSGNHATSAGGGGGSLCGSARGSRRTVRSSTNPRARLLPPSLIYKSPPYHHARLSAFRRLPCEDRHAT